MRGTASTAGRNLLLGRPDQPALYSAYVKMRGASVKPRKMRSSQNSSQQNGVGNRQQVEAVVPQRKPPVQTMWSA